MKKIISVILCAVMLVGSLCITTPAAAETVHFTSAAAASAAEGVTVTYDEYFSAVKVETDGSAGTVTFDLGGASAANCAYAVFLPKSYGTGELSLTFGTTAVTVTPGHKFTAVTAGDDGAATVALPACETAYAVYFYGVSSDSAALLLQANGALDKYDESYLDLSEYEVARYTKYFWDGDLVFNESFFPITEKDGTIAPISLMYDIDRVVSVKNSFLNAEYIYGRDYTVENGKLIINPEGTMPIQNYSTIFKDTQANSSYRPMLDGGYAFCGQHMMYFTGYLNVTYTHKDAWEGTVAESKGYLLPKTMEKLNAASGTVKLLSIGDSLAGGANASISNGTLPYADIWCDMVAKGVQERYPDVTVETKTIAQGGATASLAIEKMKDIIAYSPDLIFIEFGTNECMQGDSPVSEGGYVDTLNSAIRSLNESLPDCEIVLVSPIISNPIFFPTDWFYAYADALYPLEREGVIVADATSLFQYLMTEKRYIDMTGDFLCHPSDFGTRLFVQTILKNLEMGSEAEHIQGLSQRILKYRYQNEYYNEQWQSYQALAAEASAAVAAAADGQSARYVYAEKAKELDAIQTAKEIDGSAVIDCEKLVFNSNRNVDAVNPDGLVNTSVKYNSEENALQVNCSYHRNPSFALDYSVGEKKLTADDYAYAVFTMKDPAANSTRATISNVSFITNGVEGEKTKITQTKDDRYHSYIVDLRANGEFTGELNGVNIVMFTICNTNDVLYLSSVVLCRDLESAKDTAVERERAANGDAESAVTYLMSNDETCKAISGESAGTHLLGDVDGNGAVNCKDILKLRLYLAGDDTIVPAAGADVDEDGIIGGSDVIKLRRTLAGVEKEAMGGKTTDAAVSYDEAQQAAKVEFAVENATVTADLAGKNYTADMFKYVTLCSKTASQNQMAVTVTVTTDAGVATDTLTVEAGEFFTADTAKFTDLTGKILSVAFTFENTAGEVIYFDSFVLTPTVSAAENAEIVRVGAANLI